MSSGPTLARLTGADEARIVAALADGPGLGASYKMEVTLGRRRLRVDAVRWPESDDARSRYAAAVSRRAEAQPHRLLPVAATGSFDGCHWVAYEIGSALALDSEPGSRWPAGACLDVVSDVAQGLEAAAAEGLLAHELGLGSIFVDARFGVLIGDLGTAREAFGAAIAVGSSYAPPEVLRGQGAGQRSAVYVCGALLYELLAGGPPQHGPLTQRRPDLPNAIDLVLARALARDPLERYSSAVELCRRAASVLSDTAVARPGRTPAAPPAEPGRPPAPVAEARPEVAASRPAYRARPPQGTRFGRPGALVGAIVAALALGAGAGFLLGDRLDGANPTSAELLSSGGMSIALPPGWEGGAAGGSALSAYPSADGFSGPTVSLEKGTVPAAKRTDPVQLGRLSAWRDTSGAPEVIRYVAPTTAGKLVIACEASPGAARTTLRVCERAASTLRLGAVRALPLPGVVDEPGVRAAVGRLNAARAAGRRRLARARRPGDQRAAAGALARAHERAARRFSGVADAAPIAAAARKAADGYRALARAADTGNGARWSAAREAVRREDAALAEAIAARSTG
jgi:hypothetical protein